MFMNNGGVHFVKFYFPVESFDKILFRLKEAINQICDEGFESHEIEKIKNHLKDHLYKFVNQFDLELLILENVMPGENTCSSCTSCAPAPPGLRFAGSLCTFRKNKSRIRFWSPMTSTYDSVSMQNRETSRSSAIFSQSNFCMILNMAFSNRPTAG